MAAGLETPRLSKLKSERSISMRDWNERLERGVSVQDIEQLMDLNETDDKDGYEAIHKKLQIHLESYNGPNPWVHVLPWTWWETLKIVLFIITGIFIVKILFFVVIAIFCYIACVLKNCCCRNKTSVVFNLFMRAMVRLLIFFVFGIYWIPVKYGDNKKLNKWPKIITPNHSSLMEAFILYYLTGGVFVAKKELQNIPLIGGVLTAMGLVFVDRSSKAARKEVINVIKRHAAHPNTPPLLIFPQGTCTNTLTISQFYAGAFIPGVAVLPTAVHYKNCLCDMTLLEGLALSSLHIMSQFINFVTIEFLHPYHPSSEEKHDAVLYANNVREVLAEALGAQMTPHTFDDFLLATFAHQLKQQNDEKGVHMIEMADFTMTDCHRKLKMKAKTVIELGKIYMTHCDENGRITLDEFCNVFHIKDQVMAAILFGFFIGGRSGNDADDKDVISISSDDEEKELDDGSSARVRDTFIMFDDFLVGVAVCYQDEYVDDALSLFYLMMDPKNERYIKPMNVIKAVEVIENDVNQVKKFDEDIEQFCLKIFDIQQVENADTKLTFESFVEKVKFYGETKLIQAFLQFMIFEFLEIKLDENMIVVSNK